MSEAEPAPDAGATGAGRYCYCLVSVPDGASTGDPLGVEGLADGDPYLVVENGIAAVVQERAEPFESDDESAVAGWLVRHQSVVDAAAERFGTPLPFRFDVILAGDDADVGGWLRERRGEVSDHLAEFAGRWEYRVQLLPDGDQEPHLLADDERLRELRDRLDATDGGKEYLLEKQYEGRLREARDERRARLADALGAAVDPVAVDRTSHDRSPALSDVDPMARAAVLADEDDEERLGDRLEVVADEPGVKVRFTGPWPPYSFAPTFGGEE